MQHMRSLTFSKCEHVCISGLVVVIEVININDCAHIYTDIRESSKHICTWKRRKTGMLIWEDDEKYYFV